MHPFPHQYAVSLDWTEGRAGMLSGNGRPPILGGPPPQFDGKPDWWSPEHLLLSSAALCLMTTFYALAERAKLPVSAYKSAAEGTLDRTKEGIFFSRILLRVELKTPAGEEERAKTLLATAKKHCIISNSLKPEVALESTVSAA